MFLESDDVAIRSDDFTGSTSRTHRKPDFRMLAETSSIAAPLYSFQECRMERTAFCLFISFIHLLVLLANSIYFILNAICQQQQQQQQ